jgi:hypothetical protein
MLGIYVVLLGCKYAVGRTEFVLVIYNNSFSINSSRDIARERRRERKGVQEEI